MIVGLAIRILNLLLLLLKRSLHFKRLLGLQLAVEHGLGASSGAAPAARDPLRVVLGQVVLGRYHGVLVGGRVVGVDVALVGWHLSV